MPARLPLVAVLAAVLTVGWCSRCPHRRRRPTQTYDYTAYLAELGQRPALAEAPPQVLCELGDVA